MLVKNIIFHNDGENFRYEIFYTSKNIVNVPCPIGVFKSLTKGFKIVKIEYRNNSWFNKNEIARIDIALGNNEWYLLMLNPGYMLTDVYYEPKELSVDIIVSKELKCFLYSFYNKTNTSNISIICRRVKDESGKFEKLLNDPLNLGYRRHLINEMSLKINTKENPRNNISFNISKNKRGKLVWKVKYNEAAEGEEKNAIFSNSLPLFCILFLNRNFELNRETSIETDLLYRYAKEFTAENIPPDTSSKDVTSQKIFPKIPNSSRNIVSAFSSFWIPRRKDTTDKKDILKILGKIYADCIHIDKTESRFIQVESIKINIDSPSLDQFIDKIKPKNLS